MLFHTTGVLFLFHPNVFASVKWTTDTYISGVRLFKGQSLRMGISIRTEF